MNIPGSFAAVRFDGSDKTYDYFAPISVEVGDRVVVETRRGEAVVTVAEIKDRSERAEKSILRMADESDV